MKRAIVKFLLGSLALLLVAGMAMAADINGRWNFVFSNAEGDYPREFTLKVAGDQVTASRGEETYKGTLSSGKLELAGEHYADEAGYKAELKIMGNLEGDKITGTATWDTIDLTFTASRVK